MEMEVEYSLALEDVLAWNEYRNATSPAIRRQFRTARVVVLVVLGAFLLLSAPILDLRAWIISVSFAGLVGALLFSLFPSRYRQRTRRLVSRIYLEGQNRALFARRRLTITPETITEATEISVRTMKWVAVEKIAIDQRHVYFYTGSASAFVLPKAAFATAAEFHEFVATAQRHQRQAAG